MFFLFHFFFVGGSIVFNITEYDCKNNSTSVGEEAVRAKLQSFIGSGVLSEWTKRTYLDFKATGEESTAYNLTVA